MTKSDGSEAGAAASPEAGAAASPGAGAAASPEAGAAAFAPDWEAWERVIETSGIEIDRPTGSVHPVWSDITYPIDYGFVRGTLATDGDELDVFVGSSVNGLIAAILTTDLRKGDRECKLIYNCTPQEIYLVNGFINFDRTKMHGELVMRRPMKELFKEA